MGKEYRTYLINAKLFLNLLSLLTCFNGYRSRSRKTFNPREMKTIHTEKPEPLQRLEALEKAKAKRELQEGKMSTLIQKACGYG